MLTHETSVDGLANKGAMDRLSKADTLVGHSPTARVAVKAVLSMDDDSCPTFDAARAVATMQATDKLLREWRAGAASYLRAATEEAISDDHANLLRSAFDSLADLVTMLHDSVYGALE